METVTETLEPELVTPSRGRTPYCSICCAEVGEEHDGWCNGTGVVAVPVTTEAQEDGCTAAYGWTEEHLFESDKIELNREGYDEYERCGKPADDPLHIAGAHASALRQNALRDGLTQGVHVRADQDEIYVRFPAGGAR